MRLALARALVFSVVAVVSTAASAQDGPRFRNDGFDADRFGRGEGYPRCSAFEYVEQVRCRVDAFSRFDQLYPSRRIAAPARSSTLRRAAVEPAIAYMYGGGVRKLDDYLDNHPVSGLLLARGNQILVERYQYSRNDRDRMTSFSMAKSIVGLLIGIAIDEGAIRSIDDPAGRYVSGLEGTEYGRTPIRALLQMSSGVAFNEDYQSPLSDINRLAWHLLGQQPGGALAGLAPYNTRIAPPGVRFNYASADTLVLTLVLSGATGRSVADYTSEKLWQPLGAEAAASWIVDAAGNEIGFAFYQAVLRDWARLGLLLAHGGEWNGRRIVPTSWIHASTRAGPGSPADHYGYQFLVGIDSSGSFALRGLWSQWMFVAPRTRTVLVQTSLRNDGLDQLLALWRSVSGD